MPKHLRGCNLLLAGLFLVTGAPVRAQETVDDLQEKAIKAAMAHVAPSIVQIETSGGTEVVRAGRRMIQRGKGPTSGLIVGEDGYIITSAFNFVNKPSTIRVGVPGHKNRYVAKQVGSDQTRMLTLLKIDTGGKKLPVPVAAPKSELQIGHTVLALGRTFGVGATTSPSVSVGIVSAVDRIWGKAIQTDAKVSPTNYGGPLVDLHGRVVGVLVPASPRAAGETAGFEWYDSGIGFAIPLEDINRVLPRLKKGETLKRGLLGITMKGRDIYGLPVVVNSVSPKSAAEKAGIKSGDTIVAIDGQEVRNQAQLRHRLGSKYEGDAVSVTLKRDKKTINLPKVVLGSLVASVGASFLGILPVRDDPDPGVAIRYVFPKSPAEKAKLKPGDRIMQVGRAVGTRVINRRVTTRDQLMSLMRGLAPNQQIRVGVQRKGAKKMETVTVKLAKMIDDIPAKLPDLRSAKKAKGKVVKPKGAKKDDKKDEKEAETGFLKRTTPARDHTYWVFVPRNYKPNVAHSLVIWLHPLGRKKEKDFDDLTWTWEPYCEDNHIIMLCPRTENARGWTPGESDFIRRAVQTLQGTYTIDNQRIIAHGMGLGGEMAYYLGFHARSLVRGVATVGAQMTSNPRERVANRPLSFFLVAGGKDPLKVGVKKTQEKLRKHKYPAIYREVAPIGHQYIDGRQGLPTLEEMIRWIDSLDRI